MTLPTIQDWTKVRRFLDGKWPLPNPKYREEISAIQCIDFMDQCRRASCVVIDTEFSRESHFLLIVGISYPGAQEVLQFNHRNASGPERYHFGKLLKGVISHTQVVFQNSMADIPVLEQAYGIKIEDYKDIQDTMLAHAVLWSDWPHTLEFLASVYGNHNKFKHLSRTNPGLYNAGDVVDTLSAWDGLTREFTADPRSKMVYLSQSMPLVPIILRSQHTGLSVNGERVRTAMQYLYSERSTAIRMAQLYCGYPINIGSDDQLKYELYTREHLPIQYVPRTKKVTIDGDAIANLRNYIGGYFDADLEAREGLTSNGALGNIEEGGHPLLESRVVYASTQQLLSHYIEPLIERDKQGGLIRIKDKVHPQFLIHAQASGRWSTVDPPMAQIPKHLQDIVMPFEGEKWIEWDWDQIELRILGALSGDEIYEEAFLNGWDIHTIHCCDVFGWPYPQDKCNPHQGVADQEWRIRTNWGGKDDPRRRFAKVFIFRLNYGGEAKTATDIPGVKQLGLKASDLIRGSQAYLRNHPRIQHYWNTIADEGISKRECRTFMGRRRRLLVDGKNAIKRLIYNHPMQGGVSDIFNTTAIKIQKALPDARFAYGVHDAQKWAVKEEDYDRAFNIAYDLVHEPWDINGKKVVFPATFKKG